MTVLLCIAMYMFIGAVVHGLTMDKDHDLESRATCVIVWPIILLFFVIFSLVSMFDSLTDRISSKASSLKKRVLKRFGKED